MINIEELIRGLLLKCGKDINYANIIMGLSYFEDAEEEILPKTFVEYDWKEIKEFFIDFQKEFISKMEEMTNK